MEKISEYRGIISNGHLNPHKEYKALHFYVTSDSFKELDVIFTYRKHPRLRKNILYIGDKGSGKTILQNCWLHINNTSLEKENIFWIRCDGHKLYKLWIKNSLDIEKMIENGEDRLQSIYEYIDLQLIYVFAKYCMNKDYSFFKQIVSSIKGETYKSPNKRELLHEYKEKELYSGIMDIMRNIEYVESYENKKNPGYSYMIDFVMKNSLITHQREKREWMAVSNALQAFLYEKGYWLLKIVDGVDNVHINKPESYKYYCRMVQECQDFLYNRLSENEIRFLAVREKTSYDVTNRINTDTEPEISTVKRIQHIPPSFKEMSEKRYDFFTKRQMIDDSIFFKIFKEISRQSIFNESDIYHNNARTFLYNRVTLAMQVYYRLLQRGTMDNIKSTIDLLDSRNRFLNGRLFIDTFKDFKSELNNELGVCCTNIFYFNTDEYPCNDPDKWFGLSKTRILQILKYHSLISSPIPGSVLLDFLNVGLCYPESLVNSDIDDLRAFGMIDTKKSSRGTGYIISKKGELYLDRAYSDIDTIYYFALDSPMPSNFIEGNFINTHENKIHCRTNFPYSSISTAVAFICFILYVNIKESIRLNLNKEKLTSASFLFQEKLSLPFFDRIIYKKMIRSCLLQIKSADNLCISELNNFFDEFQKNIKWN